MSLIGSLNLIDTTTTGYGDKNCPSNILHDDLPMTGIPLKHQTFDADGNGITLINIMSCKHLLSTSWCSMRFLFKPFFCDNHFQVQLERPRLLSFSEEPVNKWVFWQLESVITSCACTCACAGLQSCAHWGVFLWAWLLFPLTAAELRLQPKKILFGCKAPKEHFQRFQSHLTFKSLPGM